MLLILFTMAFVIGPALFLVLVAFDGRRWPLALVASVLVVLSLALRNEASLSLGVAPAPVFLSILLIWLAWILVMVLVARALYAAQPTPTMRRWSRAICAMGTTVPWFGFATAQMMAE
ncbi:hypothetical protein [uncultured Tateyamaria sp.]|uniref:hypothetical protein n=1 Tax=uncultured Tateyamaria sp. TaxID=455651 RepID=UPI00260B15E6|nr:hypothetical protein [uncultured Tateyamaria sp.]